MYFFYVLQSSEKRTRKGNTSFGSKDNIWLESNIMQDVSYVVSDELRDASNAFLKPYILFPNITGSIRSNSWRQIRFPLSEFPNHKSVPAIFSRRDTACQQRT